MKNNWTPDRPTKPGKYWLSLHPDKRTAADDPTRNIPGRLLVELNRDGTIDAEGCRDWVGAETDLLDGAQWLPYVEPPDPFAEPVPSLRERIEALPDLVLGSGRVIGGAVDRGAVLALLDKVTR